MKSKIVLHDHITINDAVPTQVSPAWTSGDEEEEVSKSTGFQSGQEDPEQFNIHALSGEDVSQM